MTRARTTAFAGAALFLSATACGSPAAPPPAPAPASPTSTAPASTAPAVDLSTFRRADVPADLKTEVTGLPPKPSNSAPVSAQLSWEALDRVSRFAGRADPGARSSCPSFNARTTATATCTVTYLGENYEYVLSNIRFTGNGISDGRTEQGNISYEPRLAAGPIVRDQVEMMLRYQAKTEYVACDMPEHQRFALDPARRSPRSSGATGPIYRTDISCRYLDPGSHTVSTRAVELYDFGSLAWP